MQNKVELSGKALPFASTKPIHCGHQPVLNKINARLRKISYASAFLVLFPVLTQAANWTINPGLTVRETYSDNINLDSSGEESAFVTEINPQVSVKGEGGTVKA